jgi:hypothetical protein
MTNHVTGAVTSGDIISQIAAKEIAHASDFSRLQQTPKALALRWIDVLRRQFSH